jgi:hypothetical protein
MIKFLGKVLNNFGWYNFNASNKYRFAKELYGETRTMIRIQPLVNAVIKDFEYEIEKLDDCLNKAPAPAKNQKYKLFQYWHQGFDNLPGVVKNCYKSVDFYLGEDFDIIRIEFKTLGDYIYLSDHIIQASKEEKMTIAHFSDIIRNKLLLEYGGMWLDSTVLITGKDDIKNFTSLDNRLMFSRFVFSNPKEHAVQFESWIMWSRSKGNLVFKIADKVLLDYWHKHKVVGNYFLYHIILTTILLADKRFKNLFHWNDRFYLGNSLDLGRYLIGERFDLTLLDNVKAKTDIHKLDFKVQNFENDIFGYYFGKEEFNNYIFG